MTIKNIFGKKKYLLRIYFVVSAIVLAFMLSFSGFIYYKVKDNLVENEINSGKKVLVQMRSNIQNIDDVVRSICLANFYSNEVQALMYLKEKDNLVEINAIQNLTRSITAANFFIRSAYIYNNNRKILFSTSDLFDGKDRFLDEKLDSLEVVPVLRPVLRDIEGIAANGERKTEKVISYFYYEQTDREKIMDGAIILNIKLDWLFANMNEVNQLNNGRNEMILLLNNEGELIDDSSTDQHPNSGIIAWLTSSGANFTEEVGSFTKAIEGEMYLFTYAKMKNFGSPVKELCL